MIPGRQPFRLGHQASLNGLRGVAICFVLLNHDDLLPNGFAFLAVNTFFVLSGFLITCLLVAEWETSSAISIRKFYFRRALRLLPALVTMLVLFVAFAFLTDPHGRAVREFYEALRALFYFTNWAGIYHWGRLYSLMHTWSLSIEEQFYLVWPWLLLLLLRRTTRRSLLCWLVLGIFLVGLLRIGLSMCGTTTLSGNVFGSDMHRLTSGTDTRADALLCGCFAGVLVASGLFTPASRLFALLRPAAGLSAAGLLALCFCWEEAGWMIWCGWLLASVFAMVIILDLVLNPAGRLCAVLQNRFLVRTGDLSYGLYIWHYPVLIALQQHHLPWRHLAFLIIVLPVVLLSYHFIEKPFLKLKLQFQNT